MSNATTRAVNDLAASNRDLGPTYQVTIKSSLTHLQAALQQLTNVAGDYGVSNFVLGQGGNQGTTTASNSTHP